MQIAAGGSLVNRLTALLLPMAAARAAPLLDVLDGAALLARALRAEAGRSGGPAGEALQDVADALQPPGGGPPDRALLGARIEAAARALLAARPELRVLDRLIETLGSNVMGGHEVAGRDLERVDRALQRLLDGKPAESIERSVREALHDIAPDMTAGTVRAALVRERAILNGLPQIDLLRAAQNVAGQPPPAQDIILTLPPMGPAPPPEARMRLEPEQRGAGNESMSTPPVGAVVRVSLPHLGATEVQLSLSGHDLRLDVQVAAAGQVEGLRAEVPLLEAWLAEAGLAAATRVRALPLVAGAKNGRSGMSLWV